MCFHKDIKPYKQKGMTCAISCMLMVLEYYKIIPKANYLYERKYYNSYKSKYINGVPFSALAWHLVKSNLDVELIHSEITMFDNSNNFLSDNEFSESLKEYMLFLKDAKAKGDRVKNGFEIDSSTLKKYIEKGKMIILAGMCGNFLHAILLFGLDNNNFIVCDPLYKNKQRKAFAEIDSFIKTPIGKWCIVVSKKYKEIKINIKKILI